MSRIIPRGAVASTTALLFIAGAALVSVAVLAGAAGAGLDANLKGVPPSDVEEWRHYGISAEESERWVRAGIIFAAWAAQWRSEGFSPEAADTWHAIANVYTAGDFLKNGFGPEEAKEWMSQGIQSGLRAREYLSAGLGPREAGTFWKEGLYPDDMKEWRNAGFDAAAMLLWRYGQREGPFYSTKDSPHGRTMYALEHMRKWRDTGFAAKEAHAAGAYGIDLAEALRWRDAGFSFDETAAWRDSGFSPGEAAAQRNAGLGHADADRKQYDSSEEKGDEIVSLELDITVNRDGTLNVLETIDLVDRPAGMYEQGYYRDLPKQERLRSLRSAGFSRATYASPAFAVRSMEQDGIPVAYSIAENRLHLRVPAAPADGVSHRITLSYTTDDHIVHELQHDVLSFGIIEDNPPGRYVRDAAAVIRLPKGAEVIFVDGWAGLHQRQDLRWSVEGTESGDIVRVELARPLREKMGFGVNVGFVAGIVDDGLLSRLRQVDRRTGRLVSSLAVFLSGFLFAVVYYVIAWYRVGRDPQAHGAAGIRGGPPAGMGPASLRQLVTGRRMDRVSVAAELLALAGHGAVTISERDGSYHLERKEADLSGLPAASRAFCDALFSMTGKVSLHGRGKSRELLIAARALKALLKNEKRGYGASNRRYLWPGIIASILTLGISLSVMDYSEMYGGKAAATLVFFIAFQTACFFLMTLLFLRLLRAPTREFVDLREQARGYAAYLSRTIPGPSGFLPQALQKHLPFALAAGIDMSGSLIKGGEADWYQGSWGGFSCRDLIAAVKRSV